MSHRASLPQSPISSVGVMVDPLSLDIVPMETRRSDMSPGSTRSHTSTRRMGDSPQPPSTCQRTHPVAPQYGESLCLNVMYSSTPLRDTLINQHFSYKTGPVSHQCILHNNYSLTRDHP